MGSFQRSQHKNAYGDGLAECFWLEQASTHVSRSLQRGELAVTQIKSPVPTPSPSQSIAYDDAFLVGLMVENVADHELWQDGRAVRTDPFGAGQTAFYDLRRDPVSFTRTPHHSLHFYLPHSALQELAESNDLRTDGELRYRFATGYDDPVIRRLGIAALSTLENGGPLNGLFLDHLLHAVAIHTVGTYCEIGPILPKGGLTPRQFDRARQMMRANLANDISLKELAGACGVSVTHFARAFRQTAGVAPYQWLQKMRIEQAKELLAHQRLPLSEIAAACGFADQSHFTRAFGKGVGTSPGRWRRLHAFLPPAGARKIN